MAERPTLEEIGRYLDLVEEDRGEKRRLLEDIANVEDCPETDEEIMRVLKRASG